MDVIKQAIESPDDAVMKLIQDAFEEGFWSRATYNDTALNSAEDEWRQVRDSYATQLAALHKLEVRKPVAVVMEDMGRKWGHLKADLPPGTVLYAAPQHEAEAAAEHRSIRSKQ